MKKLVLIIMVISLMAGCSTPEDKLYRLSKKGLLAWLKRPDGVEFDAKEHRVDIERGKALVTASFKGFNYFGVKEKHIYHAIFYCTVVNNVPDGDWHLESINMDDDIDKANAPPLPPEPTGANIEILKKTETMDDFGFRHIYVRVINNANKLATMVDLMVTYYDKNGNIVGTGTGAGYNIQPGQQKTIECMAHDIDHARKYQVEVNYANF